MNREVQGLRWLHGEACHSDREQRDPGAVITAGRDMRRSNLVEGGAHEVRRE
jgi:hypothetical protein